MTKTTVTLSGLASALGRRGLTTADVVAEAAAEYAAEMEAYYGGTLSEADWDTVINSYSTSGRVIC